MKPIPIYDASAPIACTATGTELDARLAHLERLRAALDRVERTEHGLLLHFPRRAEIATEVHRFAREEKACCRFWGFEVLTSGTELTLRWDAPPAADELVDRLRAFLAGDEPPSAVAGLL